VTTDTRVVLVCAERGVHWYDGEASPPCTDAMHEHGRFEVHRHRMIDYLPYPHILYVGTRRASPATISRDSSFSEA